MVIATGKRPTNVEKKQIGKVWVDIWRNYDVGASTRPLVLMIHGMFGGGWYFENWAEFICGKGFIVYVVSDLHEGEDLRKVDFYTYVEKTIKVVEEICNETGSKIVLWGHSMGGLIAQEIAATKPDLVAGLVLVASAPPKGIPSLSWSVTKAMAKHLIPLTLNLPLRIDKKSALELILNWPGDDDRKEQIFQKFVPESSKVARQLAFSQIPVDEKKVVCKVLVVAGLYDKLLPYKIQISIGNKYNSDNRDRAYCVSFLTGHMPMMERQSTVVIENIYHWMQIFIRYK